LIPEIGQIERVGKPTEGPHAPELIRTIPFAGKLPSRVSIMIEHPDHGFIRLGDEHFAGLPECHGSDPRESIVSAVQAPNGNLTFQSPFWNGGPVSFRVFTSEWAGGEECQKEEGVTEQFFPCSVHTDPTLLTSFHHDATDISAVATHGLEQCVGDWPYSRSSWGIGHGKDRGVHPVDLLSPRRRSCVLRLAPSTECAIFTRHK
jgi:hypothetical protein